MATNKPARLTIEVDQASIAGAIADALERIAFEIRVAHGLAGDAAEVFVGNVLVASDTTTDTLQFAPVPAPPAPVNAAAAPINVPAPVLEFPPAPAFAGFAGTAAPPAEAPAPVPAAETPAAPKTRKRRTKEQIEADRIREAQELLAKQQAAAAATPPAIPQPQAQIPQQPATEPQQVPQFPPLAIQTSQNPAPGAVAPTQPTPSDWTPSWGYAASPEG